MEKTEFGGVKLKNEMSDRISHSDRETLSLSRIDFHSYLTLINIVGTGITTD